MSANQPEPEDSSSEDESNAELPSTVIAHAAHGAEQLIATTAAAETLGQLDDAIASVRSWQQEHEASMLELRNRHKAALEDAYAPGTPPAVEEGISPSGGNTAEELQELVDLMREAAQVSATSTPYFLRPCTNSQTLSAGTANPSNGQAGVLPRPASGVTGSPLARTGSGAGTSTAIRSDSFNKAMGVGSSGRSLTAEQLRALAGTQASTSQRASTQVGGLSRSTGKGGVRGAATPPGTTNNMRGQQLLDELEAELAELQDLTDAVKSTSNANSAGAALPEVTKGTGRAKSHVESAGLVSGTGGVRGEGAMVVAGDVGGGQLEAQGCTWSSEVADVLARMDQLNRKG